MTQQEQIDEMIVSLRQRLLDKRPADGSIWRGELSSSAISTSVSVFALFMADKEKYAAYIEKGAKWLTETMRPDGSWGDSIESPSNLTATLLTYASLSAIGTPPQQTEKYLIDQFGGASDQYIIKGVLTYYGKDLTFSVPILVMCALAGVISNWEKIPQLPFEVSVLPQKLFRFFRLPVVSYAIPALIAVGILRYKKGKKNLLSPLREAFIGKSLHVLAKLQPSNGGFLEAAPLTAFVTMCLCGAGYRGLTATRQGAAFLTGNVRADGTWPIDTDLAGWVTALSVRALGNDIEDKQALAEKIKQNAFVFKHPFTGAQEGGWGWTDLPGAVPDADDTAGALVALHHLLNGVYCPEVGKGIEWLLALQNIDGGMPTFCKGWGKLPFDRSSPDISAHALLVFQLWMNVLPSGLQQQCKNSRLRLLKWMKSAQAADGSWIPLWFGDQDAQDERSPVYGTAMTVEYLAGAEEPVARAMAQKGLAYLRSTQNPDGGWGGAKALPSKVTLTARALSALASYSDVEIVSLKKSFDYLYTKYRAGELYRREPIGLYFSRLWYSEELYNITFVLNALKKFRKSHHN